MIPLPVPHKTPLTLPLKRPRLSLALHLYFQPNKLSIRPGFSTPCLPLPRCSHTSPLIKLHCQLPLSLTGSIESP
jgi:hypothetical protein